MPASNSPHIYKSEYPAPELPRRSIYHHLFPECSPGQRAAPIPPDAPQIIDGVTGKVVSRGEVRLQAQRLAGGLKKLGLKRGDVVGVIGMNSLEWLNAVYGSLAAGLRVSPINYAYTPPELLHQLSHSEVSLVFIGPSLFPTLQKTLELGRVKGFSLPRERVVILSPKGQKSKELEDYKFIEELWDEPVEPERFENGDEQETAWMCYSSGTTGLAKGVETTHYNMTSQLQAIQPSYEPCHPGKDVVLGYLPFSHMYGLTLLVHQCILIGVPLVVLPRFEETAFLKAVEKYKITWSLVVPPVLITLRNSSQLDKYDLSSLRGVMSAAAPLSEDLCRAVEEKVKPCIITQGYGLTETSPMSHVIQIQHARGRQSKIGRLISTFEARLVDTETGQDVPVGQPGELWLRGPSVMKGYYRNPDATRNTFYSTEGKQLGMEERWFKTGDSAWVDEEGYFQIADRLKELIKYKGFQVAPAELEAVLLTHPEVADAAVIGIYDESQATELPRAYVVPRGGSERFKSADEKDKFQREVVDWMKDQVASHKRLRGGVEVIEQVPKTPSGKILRKNLRAMLKTSNMPGPSTIAAKAKL